MASRDDARFWAKVQVAGACWWWLGAPNARGYGHFSTSLGGGRSKMHIAHRYALASLGIPLIDGLVVDHLCRNRLCVNPDHLEQVTIAVNTARGAQPHLLRRGTGGPRRRPEEFCGKGIHRMDDDPVVERDGSRHCRPCKKDRDRLYASARRKALRRRP